MDKTDCTPKSQPEPTRRWNRLESAERVDRFETAQVQGISQRMFAESEGMPRGTLRHWLDRKAGLDASPAVVGFFESAEGLAFLHRLVAAAQLVFVQAGPGGIRPLCRFLELSGLDAFVASSYGSQHAVSTEMEALILAYAQEQRAKLGAQMSPRQITACQDETFHPEVCLVAAEPVSDFILLERYAKRRDEATWTAAMAEALADLPVEVVQAASDEGRGLLAHIRHGLGAHQAPDLFHVQRELWKAITRPLACLVDKSAAALAGAEETTRAWVEGKARYLASRPRPRGRPPAFDKHIAAAKAAKEAARSMHQAATERRQQMGEAIRGLGAAYHPYDVTTGRLRSATAAEELFDRLFCQIDRIADEAELSAKCRRRIDKARRVMPKMVATIAFFHATVDRCLVALPLPAEAQDAARTLLIPGLYLDRVAQQTRDAPGREAIRSVSARLLTQARARDGPLAGLDDELRQEVDRLAAHCAGLFQRTTSCVEGRNGQLALHHHSLHRLSDRKLAALTALHNYFIIRPDGTTAAERFFGAKPDDMFEWILDRLSLPARPAQKRSSHLRAAA